LRLRASAARFFPDDNGFFGAFNAQASAQAPIRIIAPLAGAPPARITGVASDGASSYRLSLVREAPASVASTPVAGAPAPTIANPASTIRPRLSAAQPAAEESETPSGSFDRFAAVVAVVAAIAATLLFFIFVRRSHT
jgi:hypothetical protein